VIHSLATDSIKCICLYDQQDATYIMIFIINNALHVSGVFRPSLRAYKLYEQRMVMACCSWYIQFCWYVQIIGFCGVV